MKKDLLKGLTEEQITKVKACKNQEELLALAKQEGIELTDEQLEAVNGGICTSTPDFTCPKCGSKKIKTIFALARQTLPAQNVVLRKLKLDITKIQLLNGGTTPVKIVVLSGLLINSF